MKAEQARTLTDTALEKLADDLSKGKSESLTRYLGMVARFHRYSFGNVMLIMWQFPDASRVAGFNTWKALNRWVKKGEKGITIIAPMLLKQRDSKGNLDEAERIVRFRAVYVFDVSQTDGEPLPSNATTQGDPGEYSERLTKFIESKGIKLSNEPVPSGALGVSTGGEIRVRNDLSPAQSFEVLVHEFAHEMLHHGEGAERGSKTCLLYTSDAADE